MLDDRNTRNSVNFVEHDEQKSYLHNLDQFSGEMEDIFRDDIFVTPGLSSSSIT